MQPMQTPRMKYPDMHCGHLHGVEIGQLLPWAPGTENGQENQTSRRTITIHQTAVEQPGHATEAPAHPTFVVGIWPSARNHDVAKKALLWPKQKYSCMKQNIVVVVVAHVRIAMENDQHQTSLSILDHHHRSEAKENCKKNKRWVREKYWSKLFALFLKLLISPWGAIN